MGPASAGEPPSVGSRSVDSCRDSSEDMGRGCCGEGGAEVAGEPQPAVSNPSIFTNAADLGMDVVGCSGRAAAADDDPGGGVRPTSAPSADEVRRDSERPAGKAWLPSVVRLRLRLPALRLPTLTLSETSERKETRLREPRLPLRVAGLGVGKGSGGVLPSTVAEEQRADIGAACGDAGHYLHRRRWEEVAPRWVLQRSSGGSRVSHWRSPGAPRTAPKCHHSHGSGPVLRLGAEARASRGRVAAWAQSDCTASGATLTGVCRHQHKYRSGHRGQAVLGSLPPPALRLTSPQAARRPSTRLSTVHTSGNSLRVPPLVRAGASKLETRPLAEESVGESFLRA